MIGPNAAPTPQGIEPGAFAELVAAIRAGHTYVNVHSTKWPGGEIRAQIRAKGHDDDDQGEGHGDSNNVKRLKDRTRGIRRVLRTPRPVYPARTSLTSGSWPTGSHQSLLRNVRQLTVRRWLRPKKQGGPPGGGLWRPALSAAENRRAQVSAPSSERIHRSLGRVSARPLRGSPTPVGCRPVRVVLRAKWDSFRALVSTVDGWKVRSRRARNM